MSKNLALILFAVMFLFALSSCTGIGSGTQTPEPEECLCETTSWVFPEGTKCLQTAIAELKCTECGKVLETKEQKKQHNKVTEEIVIYAVWEEKK